MIPRETVETVAAMLREDGLPDVFNRLINPSPPAPAAASAKPEEDTAMKAQTTSAAPSKKGSARKGPAAPERKAPKRSPARGGTTVAAHGTRPDGLRPGSKMATMLDMVLRPEGATEAQICKVIGWVKCRVTLKRTCEKVGATLTRDDDGVYRAKMP